MEIIEVSASEYDELVKSEYIFNSARFNQINIKKVDRIHYLVVSEKNKKYFGVCFGEVESELRCPFSAPFGVLETIKKNLDIQAVREAIEAINQYCLIRNFSKIQYALPPMFYDESYLSLILNAFLDKGFKIEYQDLNFHLDLDNIKKNIYMEMLPRNGRKNLRISQESGLEFHVCNGLGEIREAYEVIAINRKAKGYPLRMTFEQVMNTIQIVQSDFFLVRKGLTDIAAAQVFYVGDKTVQVIYWGDVPGNSHLKPINFLSFELINYYSDKQIKYIDIGPSTEYGKPNIGLCDFKFSIGCKASSKFILSKEF